METTNGDAFRITRSTAALIISIGTAIAIVAVAGYQVRESAAKVARLEDRIQLDEVNIATNSERLANMRTDLGELRRQVEEGNEVRRFHR